MSRLLAYVANDPQRLRCALHVGRALLRVPRGEAPDGWGLGFYQGGEVLLQRRPKAPERGIDLYDELKDVRTDVLIAHARHGTVGDARTENTHPFRFRSWLFAHHGQLAGFPDRAHALDAAVPEHLLRNLRGQTDSEHLFHVFLARLHAAGKLDDANLSASAAARALSEAIAHAEEVGRGSGATTVCDAAVTNGRVLAVTRYGAPAYYYRVDGLRACAVCQDGPDELGRARAADHEHLRAVVIVAAPDGPPSGAPWHEIPDRSVVTVSRELRVDITPL